MMHAHPVEARIARLEGTVDQINERIGSIDRRLDGFDARFNWLTGIVVTGWLTTMLAIFFRH